MTETGGRHAEIRSRTTRHTGDTRTSARKTDMPAPSKRSISCAGSPKPVSQRGELGALLRREKLYSHQLADWRRAFAENGVIGLIKSPLSGDLWCIPPVLEAKATQVSIPKMFVTHNQLGTFTTILESTSFSSRSTEEWWLDSRVGLKQLWGVQGRFTYPG